MIVFGTLSLFFLSLTALIPILKLFRINIKKNFIFLSVIPFALWLIGFSSFAGIAELGRIDSPTNKPEYNFTAHSYELKVGAAIGITIVLLDLAIAAYGILTVRSFLSNRNKLT